MTAPEADRVAVMAMIEEWKQTEARIEAGGVER